MKQAFTIIELSVVTGIIILLTALILPNWSAGKQQFALQRSVHKLAQDIRRAQEMALAAAEFEGQVPYGYGVYLDLADRDSYIIFADFDNDGKISWDPADGIDKIVEEITIEKQVLISQLSVSPLTISFAPPRPEVTIIPASPAFITLVTGADTIRSVCINNLGLIEVAASCVTNTSPVVNSCTVSCVLGKGGCIIYNSSQIQVTQGVSTTFTLSGDATDPDDGIASWHWDWGDGSPILTAILNPVNENHTYSVSSTVRLQVEDDRGALSGQVSCTPSIQVVSSSPDNLTGYAWSENLGWIDFCPGGTPPAGTDPACGNLQADKLRGWAKVVQTGEWISLHCESEGNCTPAYGVTYDSVTKKFGGKAKRMSNGELICFDSEDC